MSRRRHCSIVTAGAATLDSTGGAHEERAATGWSQAQADFCDGVFGDGRELRAVSRKEALRMGSRSDQVPNALGDHRLYAPLEAHAGRDYGQIGGGKRLHDPS